MKPKTLLLLVLVTLFSISGVLAIHHQAQMPGPDWQQVAQALGKAGSMQPGDIYKVGLPRTDLQVTAQGVRIDPALALGSWIAFKPMGKDCMVMGDLVLTEDEVNPVMLKLEQNGIEITALHNHILHESPRIMYMHISANGDARQLATAIHSALLLSKTPFGEGPKSAVSSDLDAKKLDSILGRQGKLNGRVLQYSLPRADKITDHGMQIPPSMGMATSINFEPTGAGKAAITGDFVLKSGEVNDVIRALRNGGIEVTAVHSHMLEEEPRLFFLHFWANDNAAKLAAGLRAALDKTNLAK